MAPVRVILAAERVELAAGAGRGWAPLTLEVPEKSCVWLEGESAMTAGLVRAILGLIPPHAGRLRLFGSDPSLLDRGALARLRWRTGVSLKPDGLLSNQTIRSNVRVPLLFGAAFDGSPEARTEEVLDACGLVPWADRRPADLTPDLRQRAAAARAIARRPELLILEEPFTALTPRDAEDLLDLCRSAAETLLVTTPPGATLRPASSAVQVRWERDGLQRMNDEVGTI